MILDLCGGTGSWSKPYQEAGYDVRVIDINEGYDVRLFEYPGKVHGILAAPPCTAFAGSGAQYWPSKDENGETILGLSIVDACLRIIAMTRPQWWALENPVGRLRRWLGPPAYSFQPYEFGDPYTKRTLLWGEFTPPLPLFVGEVREVVPVEGSRMWRLPPSPERSALRSITPAGFAQAFFEVNP